MRRDRYLVALAVALVSCATTRPPRLGELGSEAVPPDSYANRPEWFRAAIAESQHFLEPVGCERAPLELWDTDPLWKACLEETYDAAEWAEERVYSDALNECIAWRGVEPDCCFARAAPEAIPGLSKQMCESECRTQRVAGRKYRPAPKCQTEVVVHPRDPLRLRTPMVDRILAKCATGDADKNACESLPTRVERSYCSGACELNQRPRSSITAQN